MLPIQEYTPTTEPFTTFFFEPTRYNKTVKALPILYQSFNQSKIDHNIIILLSFCLQNEEIKQQCYDQSYHIVNNVITNL